jgi:hypothetical protein
MILLDDVYTMFDSIARGYDVCKIGTIGDAYIVVNREKLANQWWMVLLKAFPSGFRDTLLTWEKFRRGDCLHGSRGGRENEELWNRTPRQAASCAHWRSHRYSFSKTVT